MKHVIAVRSLLAIGLIAATLGNVMLLSSCASDPRVRKYEAANYAANLADGVTTVLALRKPGVRESNPIVRPIAKRPELFIPFKLAVAALENNMCERDFKEHRAWRACFLIPIIGNGVVAGFNLRFAF